MNPFLSAALSPIGICRWPLPSVCLRVLYLWTALNCSWSDVAFLLFCRALPSPSPRFPLSRIISSLYLHLPLPDSDTRNACMRVFWTLRFFSYLFCLLRTHKRAPNDITCTSSRVCDHEILNNDAKGDGNDNDNGVGGGGSAHVDDPAGACACR